MDAQTRKLVGWVIVAIGVIVALLGAFAGVIGIGDDEFGGLQIAAVGYALTRWRPSVAEPTSTPSPSET